MKTHLVVIYSCTKYEHSRIFWQAQTWPKRLPSQMAYLRMTGNGSDRVDDLNVLRLNVADGYLDLIDKTQALFDWFLEHTDYPWLVKCDDDVWLSPGALNKIVQNSHHYAGAFGTEYAGGPLYVLHRSLIGKLGRLRDYVERDNVAEDQAVGRAVADAGGKLESLGFSGVNFYDPDTFELTGSHNNDMMFSFQRKNQQQMMTYAESHYSVKP